MANVRMPLPAEIPAQRQLWAMAFGDDEAYVDHFYHSYYQPQRTLVLEEAGEIRAMTAWFDTTLVLPNQGSFRAAYLYAVATHPDHRGRGLAGALLAGADDHFRELSIPAVTTVPAQPSLHNFFAANGFEECFTLQQGELLLQELPQEGPYPLCPVTPAEYGALRERLLADVPHIAYCPPALAYQAGCCALSGGGLFRGDTPAGAVCLCAERGGEHVVVVKEYLGTPAARRMALPALQKTLPAQRWLIRSPMQPTEKGVTGWNFGMLKWLDQKKNKQWDWSSTAYLGLAFD